MTDKRTDEELSRAVAEKLGKKFTYSAPKPFSGREIKNRDYASPNAWSLIGPEIEKRFLEHEFRHKVLMLMMDDETLPRAACLAILEE